MKFPTKKKLQLDDPPLKSQFSSSPHGCTGQSNGFAVLKGWEYAIVGNP